jgi:hypothetical protein
MYDNNIDRKIKRQQLEHYSVQRKVDQTVVKVIASVTNVNMDIFKKEGDVTVCELWDEVRKEGKVEGEIKGEDKLARLIKKLKLDNRQVEADEVLDDKALRDQLYKEYSII